MLFKRQELSDLGYVCHASMDIAIADRGEEEILQDFNIDSVHDITIEHPEVKSGIERLANYFQKKGNEVPESSEWLVYQSKNDIGNTFIVVGLFSFEPQENLTECQVKLPDESETLLYLKEISAPTLAGFKYYHADGSVFDGTVVSSDTNIRFLLSRIEKGIR